MIKDVRHTGIVVRDLELMSTFYRNLGFTDEAKAIEEGSFIDQVTGLDNVRVEWIKMRSPDGYLIEMLQYHSHPITTEVKKAGSNQLGCSHIALTVFDINSAIKQVVALGGSLVNKPVESNDGAVKVSYCHDPEGILIELVEVIKK